jgi:hypothetical protein
VNIALIEVLNFSMVVLISSNAEASVSTLLLELSL